ncbi:hypothetical protein [Propioniciclava sp. MC1595]|nr:hypothetical protein [Propioniciclava sp. MC1595]
MFTIGIDAGMLIRRVAGRGAVVSVDRVVSRFVVPRRDARAC